MRAPRAGYCCALLDRKGDQMSDLYWDPYDVEIDDDPHPIWRRMRDEQPVYRNDKYDFWALSRYGDMEAAHRDPARFSSRFGTVLEIMGVDMPEMDLVISMDPPKHTAHACAGVAGVHASADGGPRGGDPRDVRGIARSARGPRGVRLRPAVRHPTAFPGDQQAGGRPRGGSGGAASEHRRVAPHRAGRRAGQRDLAGRRSPHAGVPDGVGAGTSGEPSRRPRERVVRRRDDRRGRRGPAAHRTTRS